MKRIWIRWLVILTVFVVSLITFSIVLNQGNTDMTVEMQQATLPVVSIVYDGVSVNTMRGYVERMDNGTMRDSISPVGESREMEFSINSYDTGVSSVSYEVRNLDGSRLIENTVVGNYEHQRGKIVGTINLKDLFNRDEEYNLNFILKLEDGREVYYYTRIICNDELDVKEKLDFVYYFNDCTFSESGIKEIASYMEPNSDSDNTTLGYVDIHSNKKQLGWGNTYPRIESDRVATIYDIGKNTMSVKLEYIASIRTDALTNYYRIEEFYSVRRGQDRFYLLDFQRTMNDIFVAEKESLVNNKIVLGIQNGTINMVESNDGNIIAVENCGRLYSYDVSGNKFATLYSYFDAGDTDLRKIYNKSKIKIFDVEENGNVTFMVYGYMNRGTHEGQVGILVEYYNSILNTIEEQVFVKYDKSAEILMADVDKLSYLSKTGIMYVLFDGNIIQVNLEEQNVVVIADSIKEDTLHVSASGKSAVWQESDDANADLITLDMGDGFISSVDKGESECLKAIGYMNDDLIYGISHDDEVIYNKIGDVTLLMDKIVIMSDMGMVLKEYTFDDIYIVQGTITDNQISLQRVRKTSEGSYVETYDDQITYNEESQTGKNKIKKVATDTFENIFQIELKSNIDSKSLKFLTPKEVLFEGGKEVDVTRCEPRNRFLLYSKGHVVSIHDNPAIAIEGAYNTRGIVIDNLGNEVYKRGETSARNQIMAIKTDTIPDDKSSLSVCLDTMLRLQGISRNTEYMLAKGQSPYEILNDSLPSAYVLNLTNCTMDTAFYFLNKDIPVMVLMDDKAILLIGYNEQNLVWYDTDTKEIYKRGINDSRDIFEGYGSRFLTYNIIKED